MSNENLCGQGHVVDAGLELCSRCNGPIAHAMGSTENGETNSPEVATPAVPETNEDPKASDEEGVGATPAPDADAPVDPLKEEMTKDGEGEQGE